MKNLTGIFVCLFLLFIFSLSHAATNYSTTPGPHSTASAEYHFPAEIDPNVLPNAKTEIWAKMHYPRDIANIKEKMPLIVMLHGNHATCGTISIPRESTGCEYTYTGTCPTGSIPLPNHAGYDYVASHLASFGFIVVSINANLGITCGDGESDDYGLNLARGRLVLKHLSLLHKWTTIGNAPTELGLGADGLMGKIDFNSVGLMGHSRGGEGVRAAYNLYRDKDSTWPAKIPGLSIKAIFEIGAVDGQTNRVLNADGTAWNQLLPMCDGDVSDLEGRYPFERMLANIAEKKHAQKSLYEVWGANHNFFNTEWQASDSNYCFSGTPIFDEKSSGSEFQQKIALASMSDFFRSHLGTSPNTTLNQHFNPLENLPKEVSVITQIDRDFTVSPSAKEALRVEDFDKETGINSSGNVNIIRNIGMKHLHTTNDDPRLGAIKWNSASSHNYFEAVWSAPGQGRDISDYSTLDFRIDRRDDKLNTEATTDFSIQLEDAYGKLSNSVLVSDYEIINGPGNENTILKTVRIPLNIFQNIEITKIHGIRFTFNKTEQGAIDLANIHIHKHLGLGSDQFIKKHRINKLNHNQFIKNQTPTMYVAAQFNSFKIVHINSLQHKPVIEIKLASQIPFPVMNRLPILQIGNQEFKLSRYSDFKELKELTFTIPVEQYNKLSKNSEITLKNGKIWKFGLLVK